MTATLDRQAAPSIALGVVVDANAPRGDVVRALARLLLSRAKAQAGGELSARQGDAQGAGSRVNGHNHSNGHGAGLGGSTN